MAVRAFHPILIASVLLASAAGAHGLDQKAIHGYYNDGEFDRVIKSLTDYGEGCRCTRADSLFAEKHLAVVLAANPSTRELGRYHMFRMLDLAPGSDLLDMFVGEEVDAVFEKVRKEHAVHAVAQKPADRKATAQAARPAAPRPIAARPAPRIGSETSPQSGTFAKAAAARPAPNPFAKSARTLLEGKFPAPVRVAGIKPQGVYAMSAATLLSAANRSGSSSPTPVPAAIPASAAPAQVRSRAFPLAAPAAKASVVLPSKPATAGIAAAPADAVARKAPRPAAAPVSGKTASDPDGEDKPAWKEPGLWIGGGAALAVIAFTLFTTGEDEKPAASKTYVVPATASK